MNSAGNNVNMNLAGTVNGAEQILAEGYQAYSFTWYKTIGSGDIAGWQTGIQNFMNNYGSAIQNRLLTNLILTRRVRVYGVQLRARPGD